MQTIFGAYTDKTNWLTELHTYVHESRNKELHTIGLRCFEALMANKNTEPVTQQEEDKIPQPQTPTAQQTHIITTNTMAQVAQQPQQRNIFGRLLSMIPISPNLFT